MNLESHVLSFEGWRSWGAAASDSIVLLRDVSKIYGIGETGVFPKYRIYVFAVYSLPL